MTWNQCIYVTVSVNTLIKPVNGSGIYYKINKTITHNDYPCLFAYNRYIFIKNLFKIEFLNTPVLYYVSLQNWFPQTLIRLQIILYIDETKSLIFIYTIGQAKCIFTVFYNKTVYWRLMQKKCLDGVKKSKNILFSLNKF